jgi:DNA polymerase/3'-5' exonuclease PolX
MSNSESLNYNIIVEFEKLVNFVQKEIDEAREKKDQKLSIANTFRMKQIKNALAIIKKYPKKLTTENLDEFAELPGIGKGTIDRIKEILKNGKLEELANFKDTANKDKKIIEELESIVGVGRATALDFVKQGIKSVEDLKKKIASKEIEVNEKIQLGVKYYGKFFGDIPRDEITKIYKLIDKVIDKMNKHYKLDDSSKYIFEICGSYRREKPTSGDIDVLVSKLGTKMELEDEINHLDRLIKRLKKPITQNDNQPLLIDDITDKYYETKYMGFAKYKDNPFRRIDIRFVAHDVFPSALLYFTGSAELNKKMRALAKKMKLKLSEYGLTKEDGTKIPVNSEYDVFKVLKIEYLEPKLR